MPRMSQVIQSMEKSCSALSHSYAWSSSLRLPHRLTVLQMSDAMKFAVTVSSSESAYTSTTNATFPKPSRVEKISKDSPRKDLKSLWTIQNLVYTFLSDAKHAEILLTDLTLVLVLTQSGCLRYLLTLKV